MQEFGEKVKLMLLMAVAAEADHEVTELGSQLDLSPEQETALREAYRQQFEQAASQIRATIAGLSNSVATGTPAPPEPAPFRFQSGRELLERILTPQQLATYDGVVKERLRKELAAELAGERLNRIDSELGLTEDQRNRVLEIFTMSEEKGLMASGGYLEPPTDTDQESKSLATVLTPQQFKKYQKLTASPDSKKQKWYAAGFFIPTTFTPPHFGGSFRAR